MAKRSAWNTPILDIGNLQVDTTARTQGAGGVVHVSHDATFPPVQPNPLGRPIITRPVVYTYFSIEQILQAKSSVKNKIALLGSLAFQVVYPQAQEPQLFLAQIVKAWRPLDELKFETNTLSIQPHGATKFLLRFDAAAIQAASKVFKPGNDLVLISSAFTNKAGEPSNTPKVALRFVTGNTGSVANTRPE